MVNLDRMITEEKLVEITDILERQKTLESGTYNLKVIVDALKEVFFDKCYICEDNMITSFNIEHFRPHKGNVDLKFSWDNLYYSCGHCNNIKLGKYENILDCMSDGEDVENAMQYKASTFPKKKIEIIPREDTEKVKNTAELLENVYNGTTTQKKLESEKLRQKVQKELIKFQDALNEYYYNSPDPEDKELSKANIRKLLHKKSAFTAFKRWVIMESEEYLKEFGQFIES